jgi:hypothetical protein
MAYLITPQLLRPQSRGPRMFDSIKMRGFLQIRVLDAVTRKALRIIQIPNTVCRGAKVALERIVTQMTPASDTTYNKLWSIWAGNSNAATNNMQTNILGASTFRKVIDPAQTQIDVGSEGVAQVVMTMEAGEGTVGTQYQEVGLFSRGEHDDPNDVVVVAGVGATNAKMYARQIHAPIEKDAIIAIEYTWRFQFTV